MYKKGQIIKIIKNPSNAIGEYVGKIGIITMVDKTDCGVDYEVRTSPYDYDYSSYWYAESEIVPATENEIKEAFREMLSKYWD